MQHMALCNRPTLSIGTVRLACLNSPPGVQLGPSPSMQQVPGSSPGLRGCTGHAFFLHPPFLPPSGDSFFSHLPHQPRKSVRVICTPLAWCIIVCTPPAWCIIIICTPLAWCIIIIHQASGVQITLTLLRGWWEGAKGRV